MNNSQITLTLIVILLIILISTFYFYKKKIKKRKLDEKLNAIKTTVIGERAKGIFGTPGGTQKTQRVYDDIQQNYRLLFFKNLEDAKALSQGGPVDIKAITMKTDSESSRTSLLSKTSINRENRLIFERRERSEWETAFGTSWGVRFLLRVYKRI